MKVQVCIIGGGPSGLLLSQLLHLRGIDTIVLEKNSREHVLARIRAGVLEHGFARLMREAECGARMDREGEIHNGFDIAFDGALHHVDLDKYSGGNSVLVYGQTEVTRDLYEARDHLGGKIVHNAVDVTLHELTSGSPFVTYGIGDQTARIDCDYIVGADGFHGVSRKSIPKGVLREYEKVYPFGWLGVLSRTKPMSPELIYAKHERGFALCSLRSQVLSRYYIQVPLTDSPETVVGRCVLGRAEAPAAGCDGRASRHRAVDREEHRAAAQLRRGADAVWPAVPRRRRRAYLSADGRTRAEQRRLGYLLSLRGPQRALRPWRQFWS